MVHMNIFYRMDPQISDSKNEFWTKTEKSGGRKIKNGKTENSKYGDFEFYNDIGSSGPSHSIRLVKLVSKKSIRAKINDILGPKIKFYIKNIDFPSLLSGCPGFT